MSRASREDPSVDAGCGYKANVSDGKVTIYPTLNYSSKCSITLGLGNATFTFDPKNPPDTIKRVISADSSGAYTPQITPTLTRSIKNFSSVEDIDESFTDADGNVTNVSLKKLNGFGIRGYTTGIYKAHGVENKSVAGGRVSGMNGGTVFSGAVPYNIEITAIQLVSIRNGYAYLDADGYVNVVRGEARQRFNMGDAVAHPFVSEFTVMRDNSTFICRNVDDKAVFVYAPFSYGDYHKYGNRYEKIIRVAGGKMLQQAKVGVIDKSILTDAGDAVAIGDYVYEGDRVVAHGEDIVDLALDGNGRTREVKLSDGSNNIVKSAGGYHLTIDNKLLKDGKIIASNIFGLGIASRSSIDGLMLGKEGVASDIVKRSAENVFAQSKVKVAWIDAYRAWYERQTLPTCGWAGVAETSSHTISTSLCFKQSASKTATSVARAVIAVDVDGNIYKLDGETLIQQHKIVADGSGFTQVYEKDNGTNLIVFERDTDNSGFVDFRLPDVEVYDGTNNFIFMY